MHRLTIITIIFLLTVVSGCNNRNRESGNVELQRELFLEYLETTFNISAINEEEMFIIFPCVGCAGCERFIYTEFTEHLINNDRFTLIICDPERKGFTSSSLSSDNILYDEQGKMSVYDFGTGNPTCFIVKDSAVITTFTLSPDVLRWMGEFLSARQEVAHLQ